MLRYNIKRARILTLLILLIVFTLYSSNSITDNSFKGFRVKKMEEMKRDVKNPYYANGNSTSAASGVETRDLYDNQVFEDITLYKLFDLVKNMDMLFFNSIIILSFCQIYVYLKRWNIIICQFKFKFFIMRYQQLVDGKKNAVSYRFSF